MSTGATSSHVVEEIHDEHRRIGEMFAGIQEALSGGRSKLPQVRGMLDELAKLLAWHFAHEEQGGYYQDIVEMAPRFSPLVRQLREQHTALLKFITDLRSQVNSAPEALIWWQAIRMDFQDFHRRCREHEIAENNLVQEAYTQDIGALD